MRRNLFGAITVLVAHLAYAADPTTMSTVPDPKSLQLKPADLQPWRDLKFGMFIHWGLYAIPAEGEWYMNDKKVPADEYRKLADQFNPQKYDPAAWAKIAKDAGMKYMVLTARHHDGFALWDSPASYQQFDAPHSAARRDLIAPYVKAARDAGMKVGLYYSPMDWRFPGYFDPKGLPENAALMKKQTWGQIEELSTKYGQIDILWYDGGWLAMKGSDADAAPFWESDKLAQLVRWHQPKAVISPRSGWIGDFTVDEGAAAVRGPIKPGPWEKAMNLNNTAWGFTTRQNVQSRDAVIQMLVNVVTRGGNLLLNVGPDKDGTIPQPHAGRLKEIGEWTAKYGESIYGTRAGPLNPVENVGLTQNTVYGTTYRDKTIYLHILNWRRTAPAGSRRGPTPPEPEEMLLPAMKQKIVAAKCLTAPAAKVDLTQTGDAVFVRLPRENHDPVDTIIALECEESIKE